MMRLVLERSRYSQWLEPQLVVAATLRHKAAKRRLAPIAPPKQPRSKQVRT